MRTGLDIEDHRDQLRHWRRQTTSQTAKRYSAAFVRHGDEYPGQHAAIRPSLALFDEPEVSRELSPQCRQALGGHVHLNGPAVLHIPGTDHDIGIRLDRKSTRLNSSH